MRKGNKKEIFVHYLPLYGCIATGIVYLSIGVIAILSFLKIKQGGADESSLLAFLGEFLAGKILIWIILLGTLSYIVWRIYESLADPYEYGNKALGIALRTGIALSTIADLLITYAAIEVLLGIDHIEADGEPREQRQLVASILQEKAGDWLIITMGAIICLTALVQFYYGSTKGYKERLDVEHLSSVVKSLIHILAATGYLARGMIIGIIGFFFIKAGILRDSGYIVNTDKAFDFVGDNLGGVCFNLLAIGTIFYGLFMFAMGVSYDRDSD
jgi:hypothetical protein